MLRSGLTWLAWACSRSCNTGGGQFGRVLIASLFDERADFFWLRENNRCTIALHAGAHNYGLARGRPFLARIGLEAQVELPDFLRFSVRRLHRIGIAAMAHRTLKSVTLIN